LGAATALLIVLMIAAGGMNYMGFCWHEGGVLDPQRKIDVAIQRVLDYYPPVLEMFRATGPGTGVVSYRLPQQPITYRDVEEFKRMNIDCCSLVIRGREGWTPSLLQRITGRVSVLVKVRYQVRQKGQDGAVLSAPYETLVPVSNCGVAQNL